jgi:hypothetical protein
MKMLGQDVLTQAEFDMHMDEDFIPLRCKVKALQKDVKVLKIVAFASLAVSVISLLFSLRVFM